MKPQNYVFLLFLTLFFLSGCVSSRFIEKDQYYLDENSVKGNKNITDDELKAYIVQKPNRKFPIIGTKLYVYFYWLGKKNYDTTKINREITETYIKYGKKLSETDSTSRKFKRIQKRSSKKLNRLQTSLAEGNWLMRTAGEPPSIYDPSLSKRARTQMELYVKSRGYFKGNVDYKLDTLNGRRIRVTYLVAENRPQIVRNITYKVDQFVMDSLIKTASKNSRLKPGGIFNEQDLKDERDRLYELFRNNGYYDFLRQYVFVEVDTSVAPYTMDLEFFITKPVDRKEHLRYKLKDIYFSFDKPVKNITAGDTIVYNNISYIFYGKKRYSTKMLDSKVRIKPGQYYSTRNASYTQSQLSNLEVFKYINLEQKANIKDSSVSSYLIANSLKKYQISDEIGLIVSEGVPGPALSLTFTDRNMFKTCEVFDASAYYNITGQVAATNQGIYKSTEYGVRLGYTFPQIVFPGRFKYRFSPYNPKTRISTNFSLTDRPEYTRSIGNFGYYYTLQLNKNKRVYFYPIDFYLLNTTRLDPTFEKTLQNTGNGLIYSFKRSFVTSMALGYTYNDVDPLINKKSKFFRVSSDFGGLLPELLHEALPQSNNEDTYDDQTLFGLYYYKYFRVNTDLRYYQPVSKKTTIITRLNMGIVTPISSTLVPYEKYFFAGGISSMRAWTPRRLGPGGFIARDSASQKLNYNYEQPANILLEANLEYRFKLIKFVNWAFFFDAGNSWLLAPDPKKPNAEFQINKFYEQIALNTGTGVRFDFSFLIVRFDMGVKILDPARPFGDYYVFKTDFWKNEGNYSRYAINFALGYPF